MSNIDKIRQEIKRRHDYENEMYHKKKPDGRPNDGWAESLAIMGVLEELLSFIDSLPDEPVSNDLEEAAKTFCDTLEGKEAWSYGPSHYDWDDVNNAFIAGAEWMAKQKEQKPPEVDLEGAARHVYESWMGGTMDDVRRDMVELGLTLTPGRDRERP